MAEIHEISHIFRMVPAVLAGTGMILAIHAAAPPNSEVFASAKQTGKAAADYWITKNPVTTDYYADICSFYRCILLGEAIAGFKKQINGLLTVQRSSNMWMQLLDSNDSRNWVKTAGVDYRRVMVH
ncbi:MAG: hypothetical protein JXA18_12070 [Chitinispirillaceae bacterium]|nr:hypothetical protein [Chitinispirillaceae bacterium]